jgi:hypothetical protein
MHWKILVAAVMVFNVLRQVLVLPLRRPDRKTNWREDQKLCIGRMYVTDQQEILWMLDTTHSWY